MSWLKPWFRYTSVALVAASVVGSAAAAEWTVSLSTGTGGSLSTLDESATWWVGFEVQEQEFETEFRAERQFSVELRRFLTPRWAVSLMGGYASYDLETRLDLRIQRPGSSQVWLDLPYERGSTDSTEVALGGEYHFKTAGRIDPFVGLSVGSVSYQAVRYRYTTIEGGESLGLDLGLDIPLRDSGSFLAIRGRWKEQETELVPGGGEGDESFTSWRVEVGAGVRLSRAAKQ